MPLSDTLSDTTATQPIEPASQVENFAKLSSAFVGGIGGGITGTVGAIVGGYSTAIGSAVAFGCAGAVIGTGGGVLVCAGVIHGVAWFHSSKVNARCRALQDELNRTAVDMATQLQMPIDFANDVIDHVIQDVEGVYREESEQLRQREAALSELNHVEISLNQVTTHVNALIEPLEHAARTTEAQVNAMTQDMHHLRLHYELKTCALKTIEGRLLQKEQQLGNTLEALSAHQGQFAALLQQQQQYMYHASAQLDTNTQQEDEIVSLKTQIKQLSSKNCELMEAMTTLLAEINTLKSENKALKQAMMQLSQALDEKAAEDYERTESRPSFTPTLFRH